MPDFSKELEEYKHQLFSTYNNAMIYLCERGISLETAKYWQLGYSPIGYEPDCYKDNEENKSWKKMNGRLIIPIIDQNGKVISLSGRRVDDITGPKYDHYPFPARRILFGLYQNKSNIRKENMAIITEGQMDVISAWQNGMRVVTSSFGAHASADHLALISRYANELNILYDADAAGLKGLKIFDDIESKSDITCRLCTDIFRHGEDLDNFSKYHSFDELKTLIIKANTNKVLTKIEKEKEKKI
jgi:DNA primase